MLLAAPAWSSPPVETEDLLIRHWTTRDGLPHNRVRGVIRSRDGFIWLATDGGAVRFDGANFKIFGLREGLLAPIVLAMRETPDGSLWIATLGGGLSVFRNGIIERTYTTADGLTSNWVVGIEEDETGAVVALTLSGAARFADGAFKPLPAEDRPARPMKALVHDGGGVLWGLDRDQRPHFYQNGTWKRESGGPGKATAISVDPQGRLWAAGDGFLWKRGGDGWSSYPIPAEFSGPAASMAIPRDGTVWLAFHRSGLCGFRNGRFIAPGPAAGFAPDLVESVIVTSDDQLWVTSANGFYQLNGRHIRVSLIDDPKAPSVSNNLGGIVEVRPDEFIVASQGSGFYQWKDGHATHLSEDPELGAGTYGNVVFKAGNGSIWLGANNGLFVMKPEGSITRIPLPGNPSAPVWTLAETPEGLWIGTGFGQLHLLAEAGVQTIEYGGGKEAIKAIARESDGTLWVGTRGNGLFRRRGGNWRRFDRNSGLLSDIIRTLYFDPHGRLWVGSDGGGLSLRLDDGNFTSITSHEGLPSSSVSQIAMDARDRLWVGTNRGLAVFDKPSLTAIAGGRADDLHPLLINEADGMPAEELTIVPPVLTSDGTTAFATIQGFIRLRAEDFQPDETRPVVFIEGIRANGGTVPFMPDPISLPAGTDRLEFEFTGLQFHDPRRLKFRNRLDGVDADWALVGDRRITEYRNLPPGKYRFLVEASSGNGLWSTRPATVDLFIAPHFWQTWWFRGLGLGAGLALIALSARLMERRRERRRMEILERRHAVDAERARIARDLHDDVGASLTQMALQSQLVERNLTRQPERAAGYLQDIFKTASRMTRALDEIIWAVNPSHDSLENFLSFLGSHMQDVAESSGLRCRFDMPESIPQRMMPPTIRHHLYLAAKEVLHNIVKHAEATEATLQVKLANGECVIVISDNGKGFEEGAAGIGEDGLINMRNRLEQIRGTCIRRSDPGRGTSVEMRVPMDWQDG